MRTATGPVRRGAVTLVGVAALAPLVLGGCGSHAQPRSAGQSVGLSLPSFLPTSSFQPDSVLTGSAANPALTTEGDSVEIQLADASLRATVTGPEVPGEGLPYETPATTCTWVVTLNSASASVPITVTDFTAIDQLGTVYHPTLVSGQPTPPAKVAPGETVTFQLRVVMRTGEGLMRWAPGSPRIVASWDFEVEND